MIAWALLFIILLHTPNAKLSRQNPNQVRQILQLQFIIFQAQLMELTFISHFQKHPSKKSISFRTTR